MREGSIARHAATLAPRSCGRSNGGEVTIMLTSYPVQCPYCGEPIELLLDGSAGEQSYIEDCAVCCRPITVRVAVDDEGEPWAEVAGENEG
jgi:hypothetical protein